MSTIFGRRNDDMTEGPLLGKLVRYAIPLGLTGLLQIAFHAADMAVIGRFGSPRSLAGVGAIGELSWLLICLVIGVSTGSNVVAAQMFGARDSHGLRRTVHTSIAFALVSGFALLAIGQLLLPTALRWINVPDEVYPLSLRYLRICFCGLPISMVTNFSISILRGVGDSRRPLYFLLLSGVTTPSSSAMARVMILKVEPGSYVSEMALLRHWSCWAAASMAAAASGSVWAPICARTSSETRW